MPARCPPGPRVAVAGHVSDRLTREEECERILAVIGHDQPELVFQVLYVQFKILHARAQVLLGIAGVLVSTSVVLMTGKLIVRSVVHQAVISPLVVIAGGAAIVAAGIVVSGVLGIRWMTELPGADVREWILSTLRYRDSKTLAYRASIAFVLVSMVCLQSAAILAWLR